MPLRTSAPHALIKPLSLAIAGVGMCASASGVDVPAPNVQLAQLETVMIIGTPEQADQRTGSAYVLDQEALKAFEYTNVHSVLRQVPGVYVREEDGLGTYPRIGVRASSAGRSDRISLLEDGIPAAMAPYADTSAYYFPNVGRMSAVEVLKGPEVLSYGPQTTSGAVNLVSTPIPDAAAGHLTAETGDNQSRRMHGHYGASGDQWGWLAETYQQTTDGFQAIDRSNVNPGRDIEEYMLKGRWRSAESARFTQQFDLKLFKGDEVANVSYLGLTDADFAENPNRRYGLGEREQINRGRESASVQYQIAFTDDSVLKATAYRNDTYRNYTRLNQVDGVGIGATGLTWRVNTGADDAERIQGLLDGTEDTMHPNGVRYGHNFRDYVSTGLQLDWINRFSLGRSEHELTTSVRQHKDERNNLGGSNTFYQQVNGSLVFDRHDEGSRSTSDAEALAVWISDRIRLGQWTFTPVVRVESIDTNANIADPTSARNSIEKTTAGLGVGYALNEQWTLIAGVHEGFAPPGATAGEGEKGEESTNIEGGFRYRSPALSADAIGFYSDYTNALRNCLVANPCPGGIVDGVEQTGSKEVYGLELRLATELYRGTSWSLPASLTYTYSDGEYTEDSDTGSVLQGDTLEYTPNHIAALRLGMEGYQGWRLDAMVSYSDGSCVTTTCGREGVDTRFLETQDLVTIDLSGSYPVSDSVDVYAKVDNLLDEQRITHRGADGARGNRGRALAMGVRVSF